MSISGQSRWSGSGPPWMSWGTLSLLTNVTRPPTPIVVSNGSRPNAVIDTVAVVGGAGGGAGTGEDAGMGAATGVGAADGDDVPPPHPASARAATSAHAPGNRISRMVTLTWRKRGDVEGTVNRGAATANRVPDPVGGWWVSV